MLKVERERFLVILTAVSLSCYLSALRRPRGLLIKEVALVLRFGRYATLSSLPCRRCCRSYLRCDYGRALGDWAAIQRQRQRLHPVHRTSARSHCQTAKRICRGQGESGVWQRARVRCRVLAVQQSLPIVMGVSHCACG